MSGLMDRTKGIGGSDVQHLFSIKPYGCRRHLWYEKKGIEADFPFLGNNLTERGELLEDLIANIYAKKTGMAVYEMLQQQKHSKYDFITAHYDRTIRQHTTDKETTGILEIKSVGKEVYYQIKADGVPDSWILQLQHYLMISKCTWGAFAIWWADGNEFVDFEVAAVKELQDMILDAEIKFWEMVHEGKEEPDMIDPSDKRCKSCPYRTMCQGQALLDSVDKSNDLEVEIDNTMDGLIEKYEEIDSTFKEAKENLDDIKGEIITKMGRRGAVQTTNAKIYCKTQTRHTWNNDMLMRDHPELEEKYKPASISRPLRIFTKNKEK